MKKYICILLIVISVSRVNAQQLPQYSNYINNDYVINPAIGGVNPYFEAKSNVRYQWVGITDAPRTYVLSVNGPTQTQKMGFGGMVFSDIAGPTRRTGFYISYAYHLKVTDKIKIGMGLSAGLLQYTVDASRISLRDPDLAMVNGAHIPLLPDFGAGVYVYPTDRKWYFGISVPQILQNKIDIFEFHLVSLSKLATHLYSTGGYRFDVGTNYKIEPSVCIKYVKPAPMQFDLGVRAIYRDKVWLGVAYRSKDAISTMLGYIYQDNITIAYSYDFTTTSIRKYSTGTHEVLIGIKFHKLPEKVVPVPVK